MIGSSIPSWNYNSKTAFFYKIRIQQSISLIQFLNKAEIFSFSLDNEKYDCENLQFSADGKYFLMLEEFNDEYQQFVVLLHSVINLKSYLMHILKKKKIDQLYSNLISRNVIEMLTTDE
eukprot:TRINITY_DN23131_c0_g1_i1.p1 TRINITY_DN23131_c0_g1~~TRINITY_DN23131_c0_g1_i1.p1  ORF type:complete len:119 (+),score=11.76 TRINITY_DN23131_c0_g1_i1:342-698(+)